ncbi:restriction endonuclease subunit S [Candidatus Poribacteria bacterium]|nr:restriction endonuclease subunit S [Candidatus Poribacteria bacterium]
MKNNIPEGWEIRKLGEIADFINGMAFKPSDWEATGLPIIRIQNLNGSEEYNYYSKVVESKNYVNSGDLLFAWSGSRGTSFGPFVWKNERGILNQHIFRVVVNERINKAFLYHQLKYITEIIERQAHGSAGLVHVTKHELTKFKIDLPKEVKEQKRIAEILLTWDRAIETMDKLIETKTRLKKGLMQKLLTGKIRFKKFKNEKWQHVNISELCEINYGKSQKGLTPGKYNIYGTGGVVGTTSTYLYNKPSVIIGRKGTIDTPIYVDEPFYPIDTVFYVCLKNGILPKWFYYQLNLIDLRQYNEASGVPSLNRETLYQIKINLTSFDEQEKISAFLSLIDQKIERILNIVNLLKNQKQGLMQKLLTGKFRIKIS